MAVRLLAGLGAVAVIALGALGRRLVPVAYYAVYGPLGDTGRHLPSGYALPDLGPGFWWERVELLPVPVSVPLLFVAVAVVAFALVAVAVRGDS